MRPQAWIVGGAALAVSLATGRSAHAQDGGVLILDARARYEFVEQDGLRDANALTARVRLGAQRALPLGFEVLAEGEAVGHLNDDFADTVRKAPGKAVVADPDAFEVNRLQARWSGAGGVEATVGRQRLVIDNARFVGNLAFRQNEQTYDAIRLSYKGNDFAALDYAYIGAVRRFLGEDNPVGEWRGDSHLVAGTLKLGSVGEASGFLLALDFDDAPEVSSRTIGAKWAKTVDLTGKRLALAATFARQSDFAGQPLTFDLAYGALDAALSGDRWRLAAGAESLQGDGARGFQTPLGSLHGFQGWADVFLSTPPDGLRDLNISAAWTEPLKSSGQALKLSTRAHAFHTDEGRSYLGAELDVSARLDLTPHAAVELKGARFDGDDPRFADRTKIWLALEFKY